MKKPPQEPETEIECLRLIGKQLKGVKTALYILIGLLTLALNGIYEAIKAGH